MTPCKFKTKWYFLTLFSTAEETKLFLLLVCFVVDGVVVLICFVCLQFYFILFFLMSRYQVMLNCWQEDADDRPTFDSLRRELKRMENQHKVNSHKPKQTNKQTKF